MRRFTVGCTYYTTGWRGYGPLRCIPFIRMRGQWLKKLGWSIGQEIEVNATEQEIVIRRKSENGNMPGKESKLC